MPTAVIGNIATHYEVTGDGPPPLMFSPGGFSATLEQTERSAPGRVLEFLGSV